MQGTVRVPRTWLRGSVGIYICPRAAAEERVLPCARPRAVRVADARVICGEDASPTRRDARSFPYLGSPGSAPGWPVATCRDSEPVAVARAAGWMFWGPGVPLSPPWVPGLRAASSLLPSPQRWIGSLAGGIPRPKSPAKPVFPDKVIFV